MRRVHDIAQTFAASEAKTLLLTGESGVGKSFLAEFIHYNSARKAKPFVHVTCTTLSPELLESELFGHEKGAFTDARATKVGLAEVANDGTLFLDEIGDMQQSTQAKLLGLLDTSRLRRVGGVKEITINVRFIAATNRNLQRMVQRKQFRSDLFYRLNVVQIELPPLRERPDDIPLLAEMFSHRLAKRLNRNIIHFDGTAMKTLVDHPWPGNLRELSNVIERCHIFGKGDTVNGEELRQWLMPVSPESVISNLNVEQMRDRLIDEALRRAGNNQTQAAKLLGMTRSQLTYALKQRLSVKASTV